MRTAVAIVTLIVLAFPATSPAQDPGTTWQPTAAQADGRGVKAAADVAKVFRNLERKLDVRIQKCDACEGKRTVQMGPGRREIHDCYQCRGMGKALSFELNTLSGPQPSPPQTPGIFAQPVNGLGPKGLEQAVRALDGYVEWCEAIETHAAALAEKGNAKLRERVEGLRQQWLDRIRGGTRPVEVSRGMHVDAVFTSVSRGVILAKKEPVGRTVAFAAKVDEVLGDTKARVARVTVESMDTTDATCFVEIPDGIRWVPGAKVFVVGRVIDPIELRDRDPNAVLVRPTFGTE